MVVIVGVSDESMGAGGAAWRAGRLGGVSSSRLEVAAEGVGDADCCAPSWPGTLKPALLLLGLRESPWLPPRSPDSFRLVAPAAADSPDPEDDLAIFMLGLVPNPFDADGLRSMPCPAADDMGMPPLAPACPLWVEPLADAERRCGGGGKLDSAKGDRPNAVLEAVGVRASSNCCACCCGWCIDMGTDAEDGMPRRDEE